MKWEEVEYFIRFIEERAINMPSILDIGCWSGRLLEHIWQENIWEYVWIDASAWILEEAQKNFSQRCFIQLDMQNIDQLEFSGFDVAFCIASFHHLDSYEKRAWVLTQICDKVRQWGYVCMTNWNLLWEENFWRYKESCIIDSENTFGSLDFSIKFGVNQRYYHSFSLTELEDIVSHTGFSIVENRVFEWERNIITILQKN